MLFKTSAMVGSLALALVATGCSQDPAPGPAMPDDPADPVASAQHEADELVAATDDLADLVGFIDLTIKPGFGALGGDGGKGGTAVYTLAPPAGCDMTGSVSLGHIEMSGTCTLPSGRTIEGSFAISFGGCGLFGLTIDHDVIISGDGESFAASGQLKLTWTGDRLYVAADHALSAAKDGHSYEHSLAACVVLDHPSHSLAVEGAFSRSVDGSDARVIAVEDLQKRLCELLPYTGKLLAELPIHTVEARFERPAIDLARVTVAVDGEATVTETPVVGLLCDPAMPVDLAIDFADCGGCGNPGDDGDPGDGGDGGDPGTGDPGVPTPEG